MTSIGYSFIELVNKLKRRKNLQKTFNHEKQDSFFYLLISINGENY